MLTNPKVSLKALENLLFNFGQISGLKVNTQKTLLYPINISDTLCNDLKQTFSFKWVTDSLPYLGICIPLIF